MDDSSRNLQLIQPHSIVPLVDWLRFGDQLLVLCPEVTRVAAKHLHDAELVLGMAVD